jgi:hypothetical protein
MAHWAELDESNTVIRVLVTDNEDPNGDEGYQWLLDNLGGTWVKTSYNANIRKNFAGVGYIYNSSVDCFIPPKEFLSWIIDENSCQWIPPIPKPIEDGKKFVWDEESVSWQSVAHTEQQNELLEADYELPGGEDGDADIDANIIVLTSEQADLVKPFMDLLNNEGLTEEEHFNIHNQISETLNLPK